MGNVARWGVPAVFLGAAAFGIQHEANDFINEHQSNEQAKCEQETRLPNNCAEISRDHWDGARQAEQFLLGAFTLGAIVTGGVAIRFYRENMEDKRLTGSL